MSVVWVAEDVSTSLLREVQGWDGLRLGGAAPAHPGLRSFQQWDSEATKQDRAVRTLLTAYLCHLNLENISSLRSV